MKSWNNFGKAWLVATALLLSAGVSRSWATPANSKGEIKCQDTISKGIAKQVAAEAKAMATCRSSVLSGKITGPCPDAIAQAAMDKAAGAAQAAAAKVCHSTCSVNGLPCISNLFCPPNGAAPESCTAAGKNFFNSAFMGFPGPLCEILIGKRMDDPASFGDCAKDLGSLVWDELRGNMYGSVLNNFTLSTNAVACVNAIAKNAPAAITKMAGAVSKCRNTQLLAETAKLVPDGCATRDAKTKKLLDSTRTKFLDAVGAACVDGNPGVSELDICGKGVGAVTTVDDAKLCLGDVLDQVAFSVAAADARPYAAVSVINAAYPATSPGRCGDNHVNQLPNQFALLGEECDGTDDAKCPSHCLPPGDTFECTCDNARRVRSFADGFKADLDNGWTGSSHNAKVTDGAGFVSDVKNCDCAHFDPAHPDTCDGATSDSVCDVTAELHPRCANRIGDGTSCDEVGNRNGDNRDSDCASCDAYAVNAGGYCTGSARFCTGACAGGPAAGAVCSSNASCPGSTCVAGTNNGKRCNQYTDCGGGACTGKGQCADGALAGHGCATSAQCGACVGGANINHACLSNANCPGSTCGGHNCYTSTCLGGTNDEAPCAVAADCPGGRCAETSDCTSQCYPAAGGSPTKICARQTDCATGEICRGICDTSIACVKMRNGAPLPLSAAGTSVCIDSQFYSNMTGTKNLVTGEHEINYELRSVTLLSNEVQSSPCPVCGGYCDKTEAGAPKDALRCEGSCTGSELTCRYGQHAGTTCSTNADCGNTLCTHVPCRFDGDCPSGTCSEAASPDCSGHTCRLDLSCSGGYSVGKACRIEAATAFGTTSSDCPSSGSNVSGVGLAIKWTPLTSGVVTMPQSGPCDADGYQNYDCNCVEPPPYGTGDSVRTQPNLCSSACNAAGPNYGRACSTPDDPYKFATCVGGAEAGVFCDEDSDCSGGGTCTGNPRTCGAGASGTCSVRHCGGGTNNGTICLTNSQCTGGGVCSAAACTVGDTSCTDGGVCTGGSCQIDSNCDGGATCDDICPGGLCTPLCVGRGKCSGGDRDGNFCALNKDCTGGGTCVPDDAEEGACAVGAFNHCDGPGWEFLQCTTLQVGTQEGCELGGTNGPNVGAGFCRADVTHCFLNDGVDVGKAEGGSTLNGKGDPTNQYSVATFCIPAATNSSVNATAGLPGPGRIRQPSLSVPNFTVLP